MQLRDKSLGRGLCLLALLLLAPPSSGQNTLPQSANRPERLEWFRDQGFGMFIHWSVDGQLGGVISHSMAGASDDYLKRFLTVLPKTFYPERFDARKWARLAKIAGVKYVMFTTKHHSGFAMFDTRTTDFGVMDTPFRRDITAEVVNAFREQGISIGLYFSCDDFSWLYRHGKPIDREDRSQPFNNPELLRFAQAQLQELLAQYGKVDLMFFDGKPQGLVDYVWTRSPDTVVTSGALHVTEQNVPGFAMKEPFETAATLGTEWPYRPADTYKSGLAMVNLLIETRAKGGNLLLNMGPKPDGDIPIEQDDRFRQIGYWMFINGESIYGVRPWVITNEGDYWFTRKAGEDTVYVFARSSWPYATWRDIRLVSVRTTPESKISVLGQSGEILEYQVRVHPETTWKQEAGGLHIRAMRAQRTFTNNQDPNPVVLKITHASAGLNAEDLPQVSTGRARWDAATATATLEGNLLSMGRSSELDAWFEYRNIKGLDTNERTDPWITLPAIHRTAAGVFTCAVKTWKPGDQFEFRAAVKAPLLNMYGQERRFIVP